MGTDRDYKVEVVEKHIMYVEAKNAFEAMETAKLEAIHSEPDEINAKIIEEGEEFEEEGDDDE